MVTARAPPGPRLLPPHSPTQWLFFTYGADSWAGFHSLCSGEEGGPPCTISPNLCSRMPCYPRQRSACGQPRTSPTDYPLLPLHR